MLKYLFVATLASGHRIQQTQADISTARSDKSAWLDATQRLADIVRLALVDTTGTEVLAVSMVDGHFETGGNCFFCLPQAMQDYPPPAGGQYIAHYYRTVQRDVHGDCVLMGFNIGWQYEVDGKHVMTQVVRIF